jgi:glycerol dehydrogenase-like iron-containing ADH family enzyme
VHDISASIVSSTPSKTIKFVLKKHRILHHFGAIYSSDDLRVKGKPSPDIYLFAMNRLKIKAFDAIVIEDSKNGIEAAQSAGLFTIGYNSSCDKADVLLGANDSANRILDEVMLARKALNDDDLTAVTKTLRLCNPNIVRYLTTFRDNTVHSRALTFINNHKNDAILIYSSSSLRLSGYNLNLRHAYRDELYNHDYKKLLIELTRTPDLHKINYIIGFGAGVANDLAKIIGSTLGRRVVSIPTALTTNVYATNKTAIWERGKKITVKSKLPDIILLDKSLIAKSGVYNYLGVVDIFSIHTALYDWKISGEPIDEHIFQEAESLLGTTLQKINDDTMTIDDIYNIVGESAHITNRYGSGRPESGSEHILASALDSIMPTYHGLLVAIGIIIMSTLQGNYSEPIELALRKMGIIDLIKQQQFDINSIRKILTVLSPRSDRPTIIDSLARLPKNNRLSRIDKAIDKLNEILES